jgi:erythromycin esterase
LLEYLVKEKGFTVLEIEANWPESEAADRYIKTGEGDPRAALAEMYFWTWHTEEVLAMLEWMRAFNKAPCDHPILSFTSFDMQIYQGARDRVIEYVERHTPGDSGAVKAAYSALFTLQSRVGTDPGFEESVKKADGVVSLLEARRVSLVKASSAEVFRNAVQMARIVGQAARMRTKVDMGSYRDQMMAKNVEWLAREVYSKEKIVLWAHNAHVNKTHNYFRPMGQWLRESSGLNVYVVGFAINTGMVRALTSEGERHIGIADSKIPPAAPGTGTALLSAAELPIFFLDLRDRSEELARWLAEPHLCRSCGAEWDRGNPDRFMHMEILNASYDGLIYMENTQAARASPAR